MRNLKYVGYGNYFPISNDIRADSIRQNSRIQITSFPPKDQICIDKKMRAFNNIGGLDEPMPGESTQVANMNEVFPPEDHLPEHQSATNTSLEEAFKDNNPPAVIGTTPVYKN
ncbi:MAG: hypothetical protein JO131_08965 [Gammaproteobacteria bacterium]|nr:hypothetical protein [Gammaproteobacteria bacterium]